MSNQKHVVEGMSRSAHRRQIQIERKHDKRNRAARPPRRRDWESLDGAELDELDPFERVMPRDERERRRALESRVAVARPDVPTESTPSAASGEAVGETGRVVAVSAGSCRVQLADTTILCGLHQALGASDTGYTNVVAVGDRVDVRVDGVGRGVVCAVRPRTSEIARPDPFHAHRRHVVAANVDQLVAVASWREPSFWPELVDRYLIAAERCGVGAAVCINKVDLAESLDAIDAAARPYRDLGVPVLLTSAASRRGVAELGRLLAGRLTVLAGLSGVGKSSLLTAIRPDLDLKVQSVSTFWHSGRHTTTQATLVRVGDDALVIDTPGIREFGLLGLRRADLIDHYPDLATASSGCRFADCRHDGDQGCGMRAAVLAGRASAMRYDSYLKIGASLAD